MPELQAARGASLTADRPTPAPRRRLLAYAVAALALVADVLTKVVAVRELQDRPPVSVLGDLLQLTFARNPGAAFSTGTGLTPVISVIALLATLVVAWLVLRVRSTAWAWALGLLLAGIAGNLVDRLLRSPGPFRGHVVDFLALPHWPVFNVADICINAAAVLILVQVLRGVRLDGTREDR